MEVTVNLYGGLRKYLARGKKPTFALRVPAGMAVDDVLEYLKIPADEPISVVVNGAHRDRAWQLSDEDVLSVFDMGAFAEPPPSPPE